MTGIQTQESDYHEKITTADKNTDVDDNVNLRPLECKRTR
jgi:hypothetical protein